MCLTMEEAATLLQQIDMELVVQVCRRNRTVEETARYVYNWKCVSAHVSQSCVAIAACDGNGKEDGLQQNSSLVKT